MFRRCNFHAKPWRSSKLVWGELCFQGSPSTLASVDKNGHIKAAALLLLQRPARHSTRAAHAAGQEGFAGNSTPLYMYSNPGAWASLMGVDFVRNNKAKGIDYSTMHVYTDQWLCVAEGATTQGQLDFMKCAHGPSSRSTGDCAGALRMVVFVHLEGHVDLL